MKRRLIARGVLSNLKDQPKYILRQNLLYPLGVIVFSIGLVFGLFYLVDLNGVAPKGWKIMILGIVGFSVTAHVLKRIFSWEFIFYDDKLTVARAFGLNKNDSKDINLMDIKKIHLSFGFRIDCQLIVITKTGKKFVSFFDANKIQPPAELVAICLKNGIELSGSGGKWNF